MLSIKLFSHQHRLVNKQRWGESPLNRRWFSNLGNALLLLLLVWSCNGVQAEESTSNQPQDIYLLIGQSNMVGWAPYTKFEDALVPGAFLYNGNGWEPLQSNVHKYSTALTQPANPQLGPGYTFARKLTEVTGRQIGIVANARGATKVLWWQKGYTGESDFNLYEKAVERARQALAITPNARLAGIIWHQGEGDNTFQFAAEYLNRLRQLMDDLRRDLNAPDATVIIGEVGVWGGHGVYINPVIRKVDSVVRNAYWISSAGLVPLAQADGSPHLENLHFNTISQRILGERYANKALEVIYGVSSGVATLYAGNELYSGLDFTGYSTVLPVGEYDAVALERHGILVEKIKSIQVQPGYEVALQTAEGPYAVSGNIANVAEILPNQAIQAVAIQPSSVYAKATIFGQKFLVGTSQNLYQVELPFGTLTPPQLQVSVLDEVLASNLKGKKLSFQVTQAQTLPGTTVVRTLDETGAVVHEASFALSVTPLPTVTVTLGKVQFPSTERVNYINGAVPITISINGPENLLASTKVELVPVIKGDVVNSLSRVLYTGAQLPKQVLFDSVAVDDGTYELSVRIETVAGAVYQNSYRFIVHNWDIETDDLLPTNTQGWFGALKYRQTVSETAGWQSATSDADLFFGDGDRLVKTENTAEHLIWQAKGLDKFSLTVFARNQAAVTNVEVAVSADMNTWQPVPYTLERVGENDKGWRSFGMQGAIPTALRQNAYIRVLLPAGAGAPDAIQLGKIMLWSKVTE